MYKEGIHFMDYRTILQEENDAVRERLDLSMERVAAMGEDDIRQPYGNYFRCVSRFILMIGELVKEREEGKKLSLSQLQERNHRLYEDILPEHYEESFANPDYAVKNWEKATDRSYLLFIQRSGAILCTPLKCGWKISRS